MQALNNKEKIGLGVIVILHIVGLIGLQIESLKQLFVPLTPLTLLITTAIVLFLSKEKFNSFLITTVLIALLGWFVELVGVKTGMLFGVYEYSSVLGPGAFGVPFMIGINWLLLSYCIYCFIVFLPISKRYLRVFLGALAMVLIDFTIEPFAVRFDLWTWFTESGMPGFQNYLAWFVVALFVFGIYEIALKRTHNKVAASTFIVLLLFFALNFMLL